MQGGTILRILLIRSETAPRTAINRRPCWVTFPTSHTGEEAGSSEASGGKWVET